MGRDVFSIFAVLSEDRARQVATALRGTPDADEGGAFTWARQADAGRQPIDQCRRVLEQLTDAELRTVALLWRLPSGQHAPRERLITFLCDAIATPSGADGSPAPRA